MLTPGVVVPIIARSLVHLVAGSGVAHTIMGVALGSWFARRSAVMLTGMTLGGSESIYFYCMISLMRVLSREKSWPSRLLVLLLLLSAQSFSLAHELTHVPNGENGVLCDICATGHGLDADVAVAQIVPFSQYSHISPVLKPAACTVQAVACAYIARAPPLKDVS